MLARYGLSPNPNPNPDATRKVEALIQDKGWHIPPVDMDSQSLPWDTYKSLERTALRL